MEPEYGGYLPLELAQDFKEYYSQDADWQVSGFNSGRAAFYFAAKIKKFKRVFIPYFTCANTKDPFEYLGLEVNRYFLDSKLMPENVALESDDVLLWTNYFGNARNEEIDKVTDLYENVIIDNCHAFFSLPRRGAYNCYSARKFFGVPDGSYLVTNEPISIEGVPQDFSFDNFTHLVKQIDCGTNEGYVDNLSNENRLDRNYLQMSNVTKSVLKTIDYQKIKSKRRRNFLEMHQILGGINQFEINLESETHMYYPFTSENKHLRQSLADNKLYTPFWWRHVLDEVPVSSIEHRLALNTIHLPIDQRYEVSDILAICERVKKFI